MASQTAFRSQVSTTRPADTNAYLAGDLVGAAAAAIKFNRMGPAGGYILLTSVDLRIDVTGIPAGMTSFRLHLYSATPPSALANNDAWDLPAGDRSAYVGYIDLGSPADVGSTLFVQTDQINKQLKLAAGCADLWGYLVTNGGFTPAANSEVYTVTLRSVAL